MALISTPGDSCPPGMRTSPERHLRDDDGDECSLQNYAYLVTFYLFENFVHTNQAEFFFQPQIDTFLVIFS